MMTTNNFWPKQVNFILPGYNDVLNDYKTRLAEALRYKPKGRGCETHGLIGIFY